MVRFVLLPCGFWGWVGSWLGLLVIFVVLLKWKLIGFVILLGWSFVTWVFGLCVIIWEYSVFFSGGFDYLFGLYVVLSFDFECLLLILFACLRFVDLFTGCLRFFWFGGFVDLGFAFDFS